MIRDLMVKRFSASRADTAEDVFNVLYELLMEENGKPKKRRRRKYRAIADPPVR